MKMQNIEGQKTPSVTFQTLGDSGFKALKSDDVFKGKTVVVFSLPGAFTPTCSSTHLPRYDELAPVLKDNGVDDILCISVNDAFVMRAWQEEQGTQHITFIPDGSGKFSEGMGALVNKDDLGFGLRSWRYAMLVRDGIIEKMFIEPDVPGDPFTVSDADTMLGYINKDATTPKRVAIFTKPNCGFCTKAKAQLKQSNIDYEEVVLGQSGHSLSLLSAVSGAGTTPQIFIDGKLIGDSEALDAWLESA